MLRNVRKWGLWIIPGTKKWVNHCFFDFEKWLIPFRFWFRLFQKHFWKQLGESILKHKSIFFSPAAGHWHRFPHISVKPYRHCHYPGYYNHKGILNSNPMQNCSKFQKQVFKYYFYIFFKNHKCPETSKNKVYKSS